MHLYYKKAYKHKQINIFKSHAVAKKPRDAACFPTTNDLDCYLLYVPTGQGRYS